jgi:hypothetical protein
MGIKFCTGSRRLSPDMKFNKKFNTSFVDELSVMVTIDADQKLILFEPLKRLHFNGRLFFSDVWFMTVSCI